MPFDKETARRHGDRGRATQVRRRTQDDLSCYEGDPVAFMRALVDPETGELFVPYPAQVRFLEKVFTVEDGRLPFPELVLSAPKKSCMMRFVTRPLAPHVVSATVLQPRRGAGLRVALTLLEVLRRSLDSGQIVDQAG